MTNPDPFTRLFDMYVSHGTAQLKLARKLLALGEADLTRKTFDDRLFKGGLDETEKAHAENKLSEADNLVTKLREEIKELVESLTGVSLDMIQAANL